MGLGDALIGGFRAGFEASTYPERLRMEQEQQRLKREDELFNRAMAASQMMQGIRSKRDGAALQLAEITPQKQHLLSMLPQLQDSAARAAANMRLLGEIGDPSVREASDTARAAVSAAMAQLESYQGQENAIRGSLAQLIDAESSLLPIIARAAGVQHPGAAPQQGQSQGQAQGGDRASMGALPGFGGGGRTTDRGTTGKPPQQAATASSPLPSGAEPIQAGGAASGPRGAQEPAPLGQGAPQEAVTPSVSKFEELKANFPQVFAGAVEDAENGRIIYPSPAQEQRALQTMQGVGINPAKLGYAITNSQTVKAEQGVKLKAGAAQATQAATSRSMPIQLVTDEAGNAQFTSWDSSTGQPRPAAFEQQTGNMVEGEDGVERPEWAAARPGDVAGTIANWTNKIEPDSPIIDAINRDIAPALSSYLQGIEASGAVKRKFGDTFTWNFGTAEETRDRKKLSDSIERMRSKMGDVAALPSLIPPDPVEAVESFIESGAGQGTLVNAAGGKKNDADRAVIELAKYLKQYADPKTGLLPEGWSKKIYQIISSASGGKYPEQVFGKDAGAILDLLGANGKRFSRENTDIVNPDKNLRGG